MMNQRIISYFSDQLSESEKELLLKEAFENNELKAEMIEIQNILALTELHPSKINSDDGREHFNQFVADKRRKKWYKWLRSAATHAAILLLGILISGIAVYYHTTAHQQTEYQLLTVPKGQRAHLVLPDGSKIWVNSGSTLRYPAVFAQERKIELKGEALFDIKKDKKNPFIVHTQGINIKVLGTKFNVCSYQESPLSVSLLSGKVGIFYEGKENEQVILHPHQKATLHNGIFVIEEFDQEIMQWKDGVITFKQAKMSEMINRLETHFGISIEISKPGLSDMIYTGKFRVDDGIMEILSIIRKIYPFEVKLNENKHEIILY